MKNTASRMKKGLLFKISILLLLGNMLLPAAVRAQDLPCDGSDPYGNCPLDNWVYLLLPVAIILAGVFLYKQQKASAL